MVYWTMIIVFFVIFFFSGPIIRAIWGEENWAYETFTENSLDATNISYFFANTASIGTIIQVLATVLIFLFALKFLWIVCKILSARANNRRKTIIAMLQSFIRYTLILVGTFVVLGILGVPIGSLIVGAGFLALIIGFGAQSLLADIISGVFIVFENSFEVGDIITYNDFRGEVIAIGIRTTKIRSVGGDVLVVNNSELRQIINMTKERSWAVSDITIEYGENLEKVENAIKEALPEIRKNLSRATKMPEYRGAQEFNASGVVLRIIAECDEVNRMQLQRDLNRELKLLFDKKKIKFAVPNVSLNNSNPKKS